MSCRLYVVLIFVILSLWVGNVLVVYIDVFFYVDDLTDGIGVMDASGFEFFVDFWKMSAVIVHMIF